MKKYLLGVLILILLVLDWAALDDITTGNEPDFYGEYLILFISLIIFVAIGFVSYRQKVNKNKNKASINHKPTETFDK